MASAAAGHATRREQGVALLAMLALVLVAASGVVLMGLRTAAQNQGQHDDTTAGALAAARTALIGWAVANPDFPGGLPLPDRDGDSNYDGSSDCLPTNVVVTLTHTIGLLPWRGIPADGAIANLCSGMNTPNRDLSPLLRDGSGEPLLYAVAPALVRGGDGASLWRDPQVDWSNPGASAWLTVRGADGGELSTRVAFIVFAPGPPVYRGDLGGPVADRVQDRDNVGLLPAANDYLDRHVVGGTTYDNADADGDFIMAPDNTRGPEGAPPGADGFNDRLVYVTIDELLPLVTERVLRDVSDALFAWENSTGRMPWAAPFDDPEISLYKSFEPTAPPTQRIGLLPIMIPGEIFNTPFSVFWASMSDAIVTASGTVTTATMNTGATFTPPGDGTCLWEFEFRIDCVNAAVQSVTVSSGDTTPWGTTCVTVQCERQYSLTSGIRFEESPATFTDPDTTETRTRSVLSTSPRTPASSFGVQIVDYTCTGACPAGAVEVGRGTLTAGPTTNGFVRVSGVRHEMSVVDRSLYPNTLSHQSDLPHWFVTGGWYKRIVLAVADRHQPGGTGDCLIPTPDCLTVDTLDGTGAVVATDNSVETLVFAAGWPVAASTGTSVDPGFYFEADNADTDERFSRPGSVSIRNTLDAAGVFNDQLRVVSP